jgi:hypothetical protein
MSEGKKYSKYVQNSSLIFKINKVSSEIFSEWWNLNQKKHQLPHPFEVDSKKLATDIQRSFAKALESLLEKTMHDEAFSIGYIEGFVSSNINVGWCYEYICSNNEAYKKIFFLKALVEHLKFDALLSQKLIKCYHYMTTQKTGIIDTIKSEKIVNLNDFKLNKEKNQNKNLQIEMNSYFESLMLEKHHTIFDEIYSKMEPPKINDFFTNQEIKQLIEHARNVGVHI